MEGERLREQLLKEAKRSIKREQQEAMSAFKGAAGALVVQATQKLIGRQLQERAVQQQVLHNLIEESLQGASPKPSPHETT